MTTPTLHPCPFCGGPATFKDIPYTGTMASGMEPPDFTVGCVTCGVWLPRVSGYSWTPEKGTVSHPKQAKDELALKWNRRWSW